MADSPSSPELVNAYRLLKAGQRPEAGRALKAYLAQNPRDAKGWWLMAHAVSQPDQVQMCLETVLKLDPSHDKARAKLDDLIARTPPPPPPPAADDDEPDDSFFLGATSAGPASAPTARSSLREIPPAPAAKPAPSAPSAPPFVAADAAPPPLPRPRPAPAPAPTPEAPSGGVPSFEDFLQTSPFAAPAHDDPFEGISGAGGGGGMDARAFLRSAIGGSAAPAVEGTSAAMLDDERHSVRRVLVFGLIAVGAVVLVAVLLLVADSLGWLGSHGGGGGVPTLTTLDRGSFTIEYPQGWDMRCEYESTGYSVCGIANHAFYNDVDMFVGKQVDLGQMVTESFTMAFTGESLPETNVSIIVMDVPPTSTAYDNGSWAKTQYELYQEGWVFDSSAKVHYVQNERSISGHQAYYYEYTSQGRWATAAWDIYIPHDGLTLWMRATFSGDKRKTIPQDMIEAMIRSIVIKPVEDWSGT